MLRNSAINLLLKVGLALSSVVFAIVSFVKANDILSYYPRFMTSIFGDLVTLIVGALISLFLAVWIFSQKHKFAAAFTYMILIGVGMLANITSLNFLAITWPLFCIAASLSLRYYPRIRIIVPDKNGEEKMKIVPILPEPDDITPGQENTATRTESNTSIAKTAGPEPESTSQNTTPISTATTTSQVAQVPEENITYGKETPFDEQLPHSDEDKHSTFTEPLIHIYDQDEILRNTPIAENFEKNEYETNSFESENSIATDPVMSTMASTDSIYNTNTECNPHQNNQTTEKPKVKRVYKRRKTTPTPTTHTEIPLKAQVETPKKTDEVKVKKTRKKTTKLKVL